MCLSIVISKINDSDFLKYRRDIYDGNTGYFPRNSVEGTYDVATTTATGDRSNIGSPQREGI
jgi:hypothetical protein